MQEPEICEAGLLATEIAADCTFQLMHIYLSPNFFDNSLDLS